ncbi:hypothetical protein LDENG_00148490, partial [Lucifuga dentata]
QQRCFHACAEVCHSIPSILKQLKDHTNHFTWLSLICSIFIHTNVFNFHTCYITDNHFPKDETHWCTTPITSRLVMYFSFPDILQTLLIFQNQIFK